MAYPPLPPSFVLPPLNPPRADHAVEGHPLLLLLPGGAGGGVGIGLHGEEEGRRAHREGEGGVVLEEGEGGGRGEVMEEGEGGR